MIISEYLYHGTFSSLVPSILEHGLLAVPKDWRIWKNFSDLNAVYLANDPGLALDWCFYGLNSLESQFGPLDFSKFRFVVLRVDTSGLYPWLLSTDSRTGLDSEYEYRGDIPPELIMVADG